MKPINANLIVAPPFPDGEIVNGFLFRTQRYSGLGSLSLACLRLLQRRPGLDGMPRGLDAFHREVGHLYGSLETLIDKHTEINFYCCGLPRNRFAAQLARLSGTAPGPVRLCRLPLLMGVSERAYLQCPECEAQQETEFGFSFVHRRMGVPFAHVCPIHGVPLRSSGTQMLLFDSYCKGKPNRYQLEMARQLAIRTEACMEISANCSRYHKDNVIKLLKQSGWIGENGRLHLAEFKKTFAEFFAGAFVDERLALLCQTSKYVDNALRALLRPDHAVHPIWCVLLTWLAEQHFRPASPPPVENPFKRQTHSNVIPSLEEIEAALKEHRTLRATARALNMSDARLTWICKRYDIKLRWRPKKVGAALEAEIKKAYEAGMLPKQVIKQFRIAQSTAYRLFAQCSDVTPAREQKVIAHTNECKREWVRAMKENPGKSATQLRHMYPAIWACLRRNAKTWLMANRPANVVSTSRKTTVRPQKLLKNLNLALEEASAAFSKEDKKPVRKSAYRLRAATGVSDYAFQSHEQSGAVEPYKENRDQFVVRRVMHAYHKGASSRSKTWAIASLAGLRERTIRKFLTKAF